MGGYRSPGRRLDDPVAVDNPAALLLSAAMHAMASIIAVLQFC